MRFACDRAREKHVSEYYYVGPCRDLSADVQDGMRTLNGSVRLSTHGAFDDTVDYLEAHRWRTKAHHQG